jgi:excisionase family DNA binding protein
LNNDRVVPLQSAAQASGRHTPIEPWIGVDELAHVLGVSIDWVYEKAAVGELPSYKFGGHRRFRVSEVESGQIGTQVEGSRRRWN